MNPFRKLTQPPFPNAAVGISRDGASIVALERRGRAFGFGSAGFVPFAEGAVQPGFEDTNLSQPEEIADAVSELAASVRLNNQRRWSVALPEASARSTIITMEGATASGAELEEMLGWKIERAFHHPPADLRVARRRLKADERGRARYLVAGVRLAVLAEYEAVFERLGWDAGLVLPRHMGEAWWLMRGGSAGKSDTNRDALLVSSHEEGFTAVISRAGEPVLVRGVTCDPEDRLNELYRLLLFYRDRLAAGDASAPAESASESPDDVDDDGATASEILAAPAAHTIDRVLFIGEGLSEEDGARVVSDTLAAEPRLLRPADFHLDVPSGELRFDQIAAPAGLAALAY